MHRVILTMAIHVKFISSIIYWCISFTDTFWALCHDHILLELQQSAAQVQFKAYHALFASGNQFRENGLHEHLEQMIGWYQITFSISSCSCNFSSTSLNFFCSFSCNCWSKLCFEISYKLNILFLIHWWILVHH